MVIVRLAVSATGAVYLFVTVTFVLVTSVIVSCSLELILTLLYPAATSSSEIVSETVYFVPYGKPANVATSSFLRFSTTVLSVMFVVAPFPILYVPVAAPVAVPEKSNVTVTGNVFVVSIPSELSLLNAFVTVKPPTISV